MPPELMPPIARSSGLSVSFTFLPTSGRISLTRKSAYCGVSESYSKLRLLRGGLSGFGRRNHARVDEDADRHRHFVLVDQVVEHDRHAEVSSWRRRSCRHLERPSRRPASCRRIAWARRPSSRARCRGRRGWCSTRPWSRCPRARRRGARSRARAGSRRPPPRCPPLSSAPPATWRRGCKTVSSSSLLGRSPEWGLPSSPRAARRAGALPPRSPSPPKDGSG